MGMWVHVKKEDALKVVPGPEFFIVFIVHISEFWNCPNRW